MDVGMSRSLPAESRDGRARGAVRCLSAQGRAIPRLLQSRRLRLSEINEALVRQLHRCDITDVADNVLLVGGPGTGGT
jgi:hypothetical protein